MYIKHKIIVERGVHSNTKVAIVAVDNTELQIQVEKEFDEVFFDLGVEDAKKLRTALNEFIDGNFL